MPLRSNPTYRQERLGAELRKMREQAGITARAAAALLNSSPMRQSHVETGRGGISEDRIRRLARSCACDDSAYVDALTSIALERGKGWWEEYRGIVVPVGLNLAELEHHAVRIQTFQMAHVPGLLQTEDHMRAAFRYASPELTPQDLEAYVAFRLRRQHVITESPETPYEAIIHEAALRILVGGRKTAHAQLERILERSELDHVTLHILPFAAEDFAGAGHSMDYLHGPVPQLDTALSETGHNSIFFDAGPLLKQYRKRYDRVAGSALPPSESRDFIVHMLQEL
ncbi:helix-turn-helix domain-containing protein [Streptomyces blattellae]|uniref:helix-turn-helix domain-containing protein n=1 Tax=Streptomyces blattellae TaxID=2569855 RepID=UPI0012B919A6|nr:helix-turn-helix transcriptional regulator [Streptomyces blattellae]